MTSHQKWRILPYFALKMQKSREWFIQSWQTIPFFSTLNHALFDGSIHFSKLVDEKIDVVRVPPLNSQSLLYPPVNWKIMYVPLTWFLGIFCMLKLNSLPTEKCWVEQKSNLFRVFDFFQFVYWTKLGKTIYKLQVLVVAIFLDITFL